MSKKKQHLDDFLREKLSDLPNAPVAGFEKVETRMAAKSHRGIVLALLIPFITLGLYWMSTFTEKDLIGPAKSTPSYELTTSPNVQEDVPADIKYHQPNLIGNDQKVMPLPLEEALMVEEAGNQSVQKNESARMAIVNEEVNTVQNQNLEPTTSSILWDDFIIAVGKTSNDDEAIIQMADAQFEREKPVFVSNSGVLLATGPIANSQAKKQQESALVSSTPSTSANVAVSTSGVVPIYSSASPWEVTANFYPNYTFRDFKVNPDYRSMVHPRYEEIVSASEKGGFGFNIGIMAKYRIAKDLFVGSGVGYIENKVNGRYTYNIYQEVPATNNEPPIRVGKTEEVGTYTAIPVDQGIIQTYRYIQVPLHISYQPWATQRLRLIIEGGFSYLRFISAEGTTVDYQTLVPTDLSTLDYTKDLGSFDFKVGVMYYANSQVAFGVEPTLMYFNQSIFKEDHPLSVVPWSVGVNFNVRMRLL